MPCSTLLVSLIRKKPEHTKKFEGPLISSSLSIPPFPTMSDPASVKKSLSAQFSVEVPPPLEHTDPETLAALLSAGGGESSSSSVIVIDVRLAEEFQTGHVATAWNYPHSELNVRELVERVSAAKEAADKKGVELHVVFTSLQSPDLDEAAAQDFIEAWDDQAKAAADGGAATSKNAATAFVSLLLGGIFYWLRLYRGQEHLTVKYDAATWDEVLSKHEISAAQE